MTSECSTTVTITFGDLRGDALRLLIGSSNNPAHQNTLVTWSGLNETIAGVRILTRDNKLTPAQHNRIIEALEREKDNIINDIGAISVAGRVNEIIDTTLRSFLDCGISIRSFSGSTIKVKHANLSAIDTIRAQIVKKFGITSISMLID